MDDKRITTELVERGPDQAIDVQNAIEQVVLAIAGAPEIEIELHKHGEVWERARDLISIWLRLGALTYFMAAKRDSSDVCAVKKFFWQNPDHNYVVLQKSLIERKEVGERTGVFDKKAIIRLLKIVRSGPDAVASQVRQHGGNEQAQVKAVVCCYPEITRACLARAVPSTRTVGPAQSGLENRGRILWNRHIRQPPAAIKAPPRVVYYFNEEYGRWLKAEHPDWVFDIF